MLCTTKKDCQPFCADIDNTKAPEKLCVLKYLGSTRRWQSNYQKSSCLTLQQLHLWTHQDERSNVKCTT